MDVRERSDSYSFVFVRREAMARSSKQTDPELQSSAERSLTQLAELTQVDFELDFFGGILERHPLYLEALRCHASNLAGKKRFQESLQIERRIIQLKPKDSLAHYNLACSYALLKQPDLALSTLRKALEFGYRDFRYIHQDRDLDPIRKDPRFKKLLREFEHC
jgi:tetratricopeptide (TPR) repeat protein